MPELNYRPQLGDTVKIVGLHEQDAYYSEADVLIGREGEVVEAAYVSDHSADAANGYIALSVDLGDAEGIAFFYGVRVELVKAAGL